MKDDPYGVSSQLAGPEQLLQEPARQTLPGKRALQDVESEPVQEAASAQPVVVQSSPSGHGFEIPHSSHRPSPQSRGGAQSALLAHGAPPIGPASAEPPSFREGPPPVARPGAQRPMGAHQLPVGQSASSWQATSETPTHVQPAVPPRTRRKAAVSRRRIGFDAGRVFMR